MSSPGNDPLVLKVNLTENDTASYKSFKFTGSTKVSEAVEAIRQKSVPDKLHDKWGLFVTFEEKNLGGFWLESDKTLAFYPNLSNKTMIDFKAQVTIIVVTDLDGDIKKKVKIDLNNQVEDMLPTIAQKFDVDDSSEYALQVFRPSKKILFEKSQYADDFR
jgi:hypothetical protein